MKMVESRPRAMVDGKKAVIFDLFHTLTSLESTWGGGRRSTCEILGVSREAWEEQLWKKSRDRLIGKSKDPFDIIAEMARAIDPVIPDERIRAAAENRMARFGAALAEMSEETVRVIGVLKARGRRIGLVSNADVMEVAAWRQCPAAHLFDSVVFSCIAGYVKPERQIYELALSRLDATPAESVFVGDGGSDELEGAKSLGMATVMITGIIKDLWPEKIPDRRRHADFVIEQLSELIE
jgi:putative hydrolase of the HAD superfamily